MHANYAVVLNGGRERLKMVQDGLESPMPAPDSLRKSVLANKKQDIQMLLKGVAYKELPRGSPVAIFF